MTPETDIDPSDIDPEAADDLINFLSRKWMLDTLLVLEKTQSIRFNELERKLGNLSSKTLSKRLDALSEQGFVVKEQFQKVPPRTEYRLTERGQELLDCVTWLGACATKWDDS
ncbi:MAG: helix-turn-helix domain-containing protein [Candidatus Nanohaloarchaea archaeon]|nr:helix-turn-helix domain-containing protein [Candidatus Nanohaloarchaea archaeon]